MVAKFISGKSIKGALNYNEHKVRSGQAALIFASDFTKAANRLTFHDKLKQLQDLADKNKRASTNAVHISLNFDQGDKLNEDKLCQISSSYMEKIGFWGQPYLVYQHYDAAHRHIHIVTTNIKNDGSRISLHNIGKNQSEKARKEIEKEFNLIRAESKKKEQKAFIHPVDVQKAIYGQSETKRSISNIVRMVSRSYKYTSLPELNAVLKQYNVTADRGAKDSLMYEKKGLVYSLIDEKGLKVGVPIKASSIYGKPTLPFLEKQFQLNEALRKPHKNQLKDAIDSVIQSNPKDFNSFTATLHKKGIHVLLRNNDQGLIYGVTYIDSRTRCVFNGSDLGKSYAAKGILDQLSTAYSSNNKPELFRPGYSESTRHIEDKIKSNLPVSEASHILNDLTKAESKEYLSPEAAMKLKKKKRRGRRL